MKNQKCEDDLAHLPENDTRKEKDEIKLLQHLNAVTDQMREVDQSNQVLYMLILFKLLFTIMICARKYG